ncbi:MAG: tRNA (adenosine(37)-N6)-threonylcarbamoyltransferase complex ATPase subunit type 1 TsaE [Parachlamydiales bacterium]|jgi:tRNA threonylcarbamoyladenosine biosynthesis protein TsaE
MSSNGWNNIISESPEDTKEIARNWSQTLVKGSIVILEGDLGAGKTTFIKGLAQGLGNISADSVQSPTFTYMHIYEGGRLPLYHFDLYRLKGADEFLQHGFDEFIEGEGISCIEWPDRIAGLLQPPYWKIVITHVDPSTRRLEIKHYG